MPCANDPGIVNDDDLWRRITPDWVVFDKNLGRVRPSSAAFRDQSLSVLLAREDNEERALTGWREKGFALAAVTAGLARQLHQLVCRDPTPADPSHCLVEGKKKRADETLAKAARWVGAIPHVRNEPG